ncbi:hypothetical protein AN958_02971 [Leucoagaricus sp. SymC.cos]|nr:hypothetical protein AN958_02971 [Leucoagaricus sp. SymC.cos]
MNFSAFDLLESRFVTSADGTQIYTDAIGNRFSNAPAVIMIPGFSMVKAAFDAIFNDSQWTSNAFLVRYDPRGHGKSGKPASEEAWESCRISEDFEAVCKEFGVTRAFVMGWSLGSSHFVDIATHNTSVAISGFICVGGVPWVDQATILRISTPESLSLLTTQIGEVDTFQESCLNFVNWLSDRISPELYRSLLEGLIVVPRVIASKASTRIQNPDTMFQKGRDGELGLLLITGKKDKLMNGGAVKVAYEETGWKKLTHCHFESGDHMPWLSVAEQFRETVLQWVKERHDQGM